MQSGSDRILRLMNRPYSADGYRRIAGRLKAGRPDAAFSTDVIVGFPGETEADFQATRTLMDEVGFDNAFIFKYSPREGTAAADLPDQVPLELKEERNQILLADLARRCAIHNAAMAGRTVEVLAEGPSKRDATRWAGRTTNGKVVVFPPPPDIRPGALLDMVIRRATPATLFGEPA
jgi:tRNA-2-methylthio-N6-dimethylallyladenosine synthase